MYPLFSGCNKPNKQKAEDDSSNKAIRVDESQLMSVASGVFRSSSSLDRDQQSAVIHGSIGPCNPSVTSNGVSWEVWRH